MPVLLLPLRMVCKCNKVIKRSFPGSKLEVPWPHTAISLNIKTTCLNSGPLLAPKIPLSCWDMDSTRAAGVLWHQTSNLASISFKSSQLWDGAAKAQLDLSASRRCSIRFSFGELRGPSQLELFKSYTSFLNTVCAVISMKEVTTFREYFCCEGMHVVAGMFW